MLFSPQIRTKISPPKHNASLYHAKHDYTLVMRYLWLYAVCDTDQTVHTLGE